MHNTTTLKLKRKLNSVINNFSNNRFFSTVTCQNVLCEESQSQHIHTTERLFFSLAIFSRLRKSGPDISLLLLVTPDRFKSCH